ncbi:MAG: pectinesterase family protein [Clostridium perfringens]|nr:pectinesterase family protein [Clostridium perfringens]
MRKEIKKTIVALSTIFAMIISIVPNSITALATSKGVLPKGFTDVSIGNDGNGQESSFNSDNKEFTIVGSGDFIGKDLNSTDSYEFVSYKVVGDATITARLVDFDMTNAMYGQTGLFMRSDESTDSADYFGVYWDNKANEYRYAYRDNSSEKTGAATISGLTQDSKELYIRITKDGNTFRYTIAKDSLFTQVVSSNSQGVSCTNNTWYLGFVVSNGSSDSSAISTFDNVKIESSSKIYYDSSLDEQLLDTVENLKTVSSDSKVTLSWNDVVDAKNYVIKRATDSNGEFTEVATIESSNTTYIDSSVTNFTTYYYKVMATNDEGKSNDSQVAMAMPNNSNPLNLQYEEKAAIFNMIEEPNDTVFSSNITIKGSTDKDGAIKINQNDETVLSVDKNKNEVFEQSFILKEGRNVIEIYQTTNSGETTLKTYNIVYLKQSSYDIVVDSSFSGEDGTLVNNKATFKTIQGAVSSVSSKNKERVTILVKNGTYKEKTVVKSPYISIIGEDSKKTIWTYDDANATPKPEGGTYGTGGSASVTIKTSAIGFTAENIAIENAFEEKGNEGEQAVALNNQADQSIFVNCRFVGNQDTLLANASSGSPARQYYYNCYIEGDVDFIFGRAQAVFDNCEIASLNRNSTSNNGYITAASTWDRDSYGYLIINSRLVGLDNIADNTVSLGRPWRSSDAKYTITPGVTYVNCYMGSHITLKGWDDMSATSLASTSRFYEFGSFGPGAKLSSTRPVLTLEESKSYTMSNIFTHNSAKKYDENNDIYVDAYNNDWNPTSLANNINIHSLYIKDGKEEEETEKEIVPIESVKLNEEKIILEIGENKELIATVYPENATDKRVTFESSNESVITVEENGKVIAMGSGEAIITVKAGEKTATCLVIVNEEINNEPVIEASDITINVGDIFNPMNNVFASDTEDGDITNIVEIEENTVDTSKAGVYKVIYKVSDSKGLVVKKEIQVTVLGKILDSNELTINSLRSKTSKVTGKGIKGATVEAYINGIKVGTSTVNSKGEYSIKIAKQNPGTIIEVKMIVNNESISNTVMVIDKFKKFKVSSIKSSTVTITGVGTTGALVNAYVGDELIGSSIVDSNGDYKINIDSQKQGQKVRVEMTLLGYETVSKEISVKK